MKRLLLLCLLIPSVAWADGPSNPPRYITPTPGAAVDGGCSPTGLFFSADAGPLACVNGHYSSAGGSGGGGVPSGPAGGYLGGTYPDPTVLYVVPISVAPGDSCAGVPANAVAFSVDLTNLVSYGDTTLPLICSGSVWLPLGSNRVVPMQAPPTEPCSDASPPAWVLAGSPPNFTLDVYTCHQTDLDDGGTAFLWTNTVLLVNGDPTVANGIPIADGTVWNTVAVSGAIYLDGGSFQLTNQVLPATVTNHATVIGRVTAALASVGPCADGQLQVGANSADPACQTVLGDVAFTKNGTMTLNQIDHFQEFSAGTALFGGIETDTAYENGDFTATTYGPYNVDTSGGNITATLINCSGSHGFTTVVKKTSASNTLNIATAAASGQKIDNVDRSGGSPLAITASNVSTLLVCGNCNAANDNNWCIQ